MVDVSHLNEAGFWDVARINQAPLVATHSNAHALCASTRNLTDRQLDAIGESGGVVGRQLRDRVPARGRRPRHGRAAQRRSCATSTTSPSGSASSMSRSARTSTAPRCPTSSAGSPACRACVERFARRVRRATALDKITHGNWLRVLGATWDRGAATSSRASLEPRPTLLEAAERFAEPGLAVDLGAGTGRDTLELLRRGWRVLAIDGRAGGGRTAPGARRGRRAARDARGARSSRPPGRRATLLNASFSLPFCPPALFPALWGRIVGSIVPRRTLRRPVLRRATTTGRGPGSIVQTRAEVEALLEPFEVELLDEFDGEGPTAIGKTKHWHVFHVVARKR